MGENGQAREGCFWETATRVPDSSRVASERSEEDPLVGSILGGCKIIGRLGEGAMAVVYRAEQLRLARPVAVKVLLPALLARDESCAARFVAEARIAARLEHPNVVRVYDAGEENGRYYLVMELVDGATVKQAVREWGPVPVTDTLRVVLQVARGLAVAHRGGMVHRDVKASNILVDRQGEARIADFGLAKCLEADPGLTRSGAVMGTPIYMSPEQCRGEPVDGRSDIYALGVTTYEMLTGRPPFEGPTALAIMYSHQHTALPRDALDQAGVPEPVVALVEKMTAKDRSDRYANPDELAAEVAVLLGEGVAGGGHAFDDRERFAHAEAALQVICQRCPRLPDAESAWAAFIEWRGSRDADYLRRIRRGRMHIFYSILHDLYAFAEETCGQNVAREIGEQLSAELLDTHLPDLLHATLGSGEALCRQIAWLVDRFTSQLNRAIYIFDCKPSTSGRSVHMSMGYTHEEPMVEYLRRAGHNPERAFANSFQVFEGALRVLAARAVFGMTPEQITATREGLHGEFVLRLTDQSRFHYENIIDILMSYVRRLGERKPAEAVPDVVSPPAHASEAMKAAWASMRKAAASEETVLLQGESGTGKSYYARRIHEMGARSPEAFVEVGMTADVGSDNLIQSNLFGHVRGAFTGADEDKRGLFSLADGGTIFLDEIGDASPQVQAKLLRVLDEKTFRMLGSLQDISVDVRIIAATNQNLQQLVKEGRFRKDLFYRLNVIPIRLPPLRERRADMPVLVERLFERVTANAGRTDIRLSDEAFAALYAYDWPGNVRELLNALRHAVAFSQESEVALEALPSAVRSGPSRPVPPGGVAGVINVAALREAVAQDDPPAGVPTFEWPGHVDYARREYLRELILQHSGRLKEIAEHWNRSSANTIRRLIREFDLEGALRAARKDAR